VSSTEHLAKKFGGAARMQQLTAHVASVAQGAGIAIDFARQRAVNTRLAHRAVAIARADGKEDVVVEALFKAHFEDGDDLSDVYLVAGDLDRAGVAGARARLDSGEGAKDVDADRAAAAEIGIDGVPFFILDERLAVSGAQEPSTFLAFLREGQKAAG
jgi:predicted DsbA family dithiol-disulfide isomerase